jgi:hypothetical protein
VSFQAARRIPKIGEPDVEFLQKLKEQLLALASTVKAMKGTLADEVDMRLRALASMLVSLMVMSAPRPEDIVGTLENIAAALREMIDLLDGYPNFSAIRHQLAALAKQVHLARTSGDLEGTTDLGEVLRDAIAATAAEDNTGPTAEDLERIVRFAEGALKERETDAKRIAETIAGTTNNPWAVLAEAFTKAYPAIIAVVMGSQQAKTEERELLSISRLAQIFMANHATDAATAFKCAKEFYAYHRTWMQTEGRDFLKSFDAAVPPPPSEAAAPAVN